MLGVERKAVLHGIDRSGAGGGNSATFWRHPRFSGMNLLKARFRTHRYELHTHPTYVVALITEGCERLRIEGRRQVAPAGTVIVVNPEQCHDGEPGADGGWTYRVLYPPLELMTQLAAELGRAAPPEFGRPCIDDPALAAAVLAAHFAAERGTAMEAEATLLTAMERLISRHAEDRCRPQPDVDRAGGRMLLYRRLIRDAEDESLDLSRLAAAAGVTRFQVIRDFKRHTGLTPMAFLRNRKLRRASRLIEAGAGLAEAATLAGFSDQSHLARVFRGMIGITPGAFRAAVLQRAGHAPQLLCQPAV